MAVASQPFDLLTPWLELGQQNQDLWYRTLAFWSGGDTTAHVFDETLDMYRIGQEFLTRSVRNSVDFALQNLNIATASDLDEVRQSLADTHATLAGLKGALEAIDVEGRVAPVEARVTKLADNLDTAQRSSRALGSRVQTLESSLRTAEATLDNTVKESGNAAGKIAPINRRLGSVEKRVDEVASDRAAADDLRALETRLGAIEGRIDEIVRQLDQPAQPRAEAPAPAPAPAQEPSEAPTESDPKPRRNATKRATE